MTRRRAHRLYVIHGSHPCVAVEGALRVKGQSWTRRELVPPTQVVFMRLRFGRPTVPAIRFADGERCSGSMAIMRRLDERWPEPPLYADDPELRARQDEAERWGDDELQMIARRLLFGGFRRRPDAMHSFQAGAKLRFPRWVTRLAAPLIIAGEWRVHRITEQLVERDIAQLPATFDRIDRWIEEGVLGGERVSAADLQIAGSVGLLLTIEDVRTRYGDRPAARMAERVLPRFDGTLPIGTLIRN
jgi:glutathione S-transferase